MTTGPRAMQPAEWEAYTLHLQRVPVEAIEEQTGLSRPRIAAAVDLGQLHAQTALQTTAAAKPKPAVAPRPVRVRQAAKKQLPGATIPPGPVLSVAPDPQATPGSPVADTAVTTVPAPVLPAAPKERLRRPVKQPAKPVDRDEKIRVLKALIEGVRKHLTEYETELAELLDTNPAPPPAPSPEPGPSPELADSPEVRNWATATGWAIPPASQRLPGAIVLAYLKAHGGTP